MGRYSFSVLGIKKASSISYEMRADRVCINVAPDDAGGTSLALTFEDAKAFVDELQRSLRVPLVAIPMLEGTPAPAASAPLLLKFKRVRANDLPVPAKAKRDDAGFDLCLDLTEPHGVKVINLGSWSGNTSELSVSAGSIIDVPIGFAVEIPSGYEGQIRGRSGLAFKSACTVFHVGTIDAGYRGELRVLLKCEQAMTFHHGDRIAQLVLSPIPKMQVFEVNELNESDRGEGGFGSTGR